MTVHINEKGFTPSEINIQVGTEVIFVNIGEQEHWPAGNDHPSHILYDGTNLKTHCDPLFSPKSFDACKGIKKEETWSFVFDKVGTYKFHDHLWPQFEGVITVFQKDFEQFLLTGSNALDVKQYEELKDKLEKIVEDSDPRQAIRELQDLSLLNQKISDQCHDFLHIIGHAGYEKYKSFHEAVEYQEDFCNSGYIHGLFEEYFKSSDNLVFDLGKECKNYAENKRGIDLWNCNHGIGHGFMYFTGGDIDKTLNLCEENLDGGAGITSCQNGAYMEFFNKEELAKEKEYVDSANPLNTCKIRKSSKGDCHLYAPVYFSQTLGKNFVDIFKECKKAELGYEMDCLRGIGMEAMKKNMHTPEAVLELCAQAGSYVKQEACIGGAVGMYILQEGSVSAGENLCGEIKGRHKNACFTEVKRKEIFFK